MLPRTCSLNLSLVHMYIHCNSNITRSLGSTETKRVITDSVMYTRPLFKIFNTTSFTCFHIRKQMPHPPSFGIGHQSVYLVYSYNTQTFHKSWYQQVYVGRIIELQLIYCIYFIQIPVKLLVLVTKTHCTHVHKRSNNRNGPSTSQPIALTSTITAL